MRRTGGRKVACIPRTVSSLLRDLSLCVYMSVSYLLRHTDQEFGAGKSPPKSSKHGRPNDDDEEFSQPRKRHHVSNANIKHLPNDVELPTKWVSMRGAAEKLCSLSAVLASAVEVTSHACHISK
jgi:hypothetical protein